jgi:AcrR family transcriptional regulator
VLDAAIRLADEHGIEALTMRKLGEALGVEAMSLYYHVANKGDLVDAIVDRVVDEIELPSGDDDWRTAIRTCAISGHRTFLRHPWACQLAMFPTTRGARTPRLRYMEWLLGRLHDAGFSPELTYSGSHALDSHIMGFTLWQLGHRAGASEAGGEGDVAAFVARFVRELRADDYPHLADHVEQHLAAPDDDGEREFGFGLDLILDGLERARWRGAEGV